MSEALFEVDGERVVPTAQARGPWDPGSLHGGPVGALVARELERSTDGGPVGNLSRITLELLRPVPMAPLLVTSRVLRPGRLVQLVEAVVTEAATGRELVLARALRIRGEQVALPEDDELVTTSLGPESGHRRPPPPEAGAIGRSERQAADGLAFHASATEHRFTHGTWEPGPVMDWIRLTVPVVAGEEPSGWQRLMAAADFGNGISRVLPWDGWLFINPDLTVHARRAPVGEWIGLDAGTHLGPDGSALAESTLWDAAGFLGRAVQSLLIAPR